MKVIGKLLAGTLGGVVVAGLFLLIVTLPLANHVDLQDSVLFTITLGFWGLLILLSLIAKRPARAWRLQFILAALFCFALPLSAILFTGANMIDVDNTPELVGTFLGGSLVTMMAGVTGFFAGLILLIIGLLIGRDETVVVVRETSRKTPTL